MGRGENIGEDIGENTGTSGVIILPGGETGDVIQSTFNVDSQYYGDRVQTIPPPLGTTGDKIYCVFGDGAYWDPGSGVTPYHGTGLCEVHIKETDTDYGYNYYLNELVGGSPGEGGQLWVRGYHLWPADYELVVEHKSKGYRYSMENASYAINLLFGGGDGDVDVANAANPDLFNTNFPNKTIDWDFIGQGWQCVETYIYFTATPGNGIFRVWLNGDLKFDDSPETGTGTNTLITANDECDRMRLYEFISNYGSPKDQTCYADCMCLTSDVNATIVDPGSGYRYIGPNRWLT